VAPAGPRIEIFAGYDKMMNKGRSFTESVDACLDYYCADSVTSIGYGFDRSRDEALVFGIGAGYDFAVSNNFSLGIDIEASKSSVETTEGRVTDFFDPAAPVFGDDGTTVYYYEPLRRRYDTKGGTDLYLGARASFALGDNAIIYAKAGYTNWTVRERLYDVDFLSGEVRQTLSSDKRNLGGYRLGIGATFGNGRLYGGPEYRYSHYGSGYSKHQVVLVGGIRFRRVEAPPPPPPPRPPPPPPPATQTCPAGSVILATDACPAPPPPPPPPEPAPEPGCGLGLD